MALRSYLVSTGHNSLWTLREGTNKSYWGEFGGFVASQSGRALSPSPPQPSNTSSQLHRLLLIPEGLEDSSVCGVRPWVGEEELTAQGTETH